MEILIDVFVIVWHVIFAAKNGSESFLLLFVGMEYRIEIYGLRAR